MARHRSLSQRSHFLVFIALLALAALSYGLSFAHLGALRVPAALAVSAAKAGLVAIFFMELVHQRSTHRLVPITALLLVGILIGLMAADTLTRDTPALADCCRAGSVVAGHAD